MNYRLPVLSSDDIIDKYDQWNLVGDEVHDYTAPTP